MSRVGILTSGRWDYSYLKSIFDELEDAGFECFWYVISENDSEFSRLMIDLYPRKSINVKLRDFSANRERMTVFLSEMQKDLVEKLEDLNYAVLLGDRAEIFSGASVLFCLGIPFAHIAAGDRTRGAIDDNFRFAISSLADTHFAFSENSFETLKTTQLNSRGIFLTHPPQYARIISESQSTLEELTNIINMEANQSFVLATFHVETKSEVTLSNQIDYTRDLISELSKFTKIVATSPNGDPGSQDMLAMLEEVSSSNSNVKLFSQLGEPNYWKVLRAAKCLIGNSSSGIYEAPILGVPVVNIGKRQDGRITSMVDLDFDWGVCSAIEMSEEIKGLIARRQDKDFKGSDSLTGGKLSEILIRCINKLED